MLTQVLSKLIERVLGYYVEDINSEKLSVGLIDGRFEVHIIVLPSDQLFFQAT